MALERIDWIILVAFFAISLAIGLYAARRASQGTTEFFLGGRDLPWWMLGISMVATTFSADTPNLVTDIVRQNGVMGNWVWWAFLLTGMLTVFVYARLWRRAGLLTDLEFYEMRYSGPEATFLRGFRAIYLGVIFNVLVMAGVCLAAIKMGQVLLGLSPVETVLIAGTVTVLYSALGGLRGVILTDLFQFALAMVGSVGAAYVILNLPEVNGLGNLLAQPEVAARLDLVPDFGTEEAIVLLVIPLAVQWWATWYPGSEPGGGGYVAQRMLAARSERGAVGATLLFNVAHYALRPWPWLLIALASLLVFPDLDSLRMAFPALPDDKIGHDLAYPAMLRLLPAGLLGVVVASLIAAFMSTLSTHLNWGASYVTHDIYRRFADRNASEKQLVWVGRVVTVGLMMLAAVGALLLNNALQAFGILLQIGAGTGLLFILRWFWWRINAYSEITAMAVSFVIAIVFAVMGDDAPSYTFQLLFGVGVTTVAWLAVTLVTRPTNREVLRAFYNKIHPDGPGWSPVSGERSWGDLPRQIGMMLLGCALVYSLLFATGKFLYKEFWVGSVLLSVAIVAGIILGKMLHRRV